MHVMTDAESCLANSARRDGTRDKSTNAPGVAQQPASWNGCGVGSVAAALVAVRVVAAGVDPLRPIGRPRLSPAAVVISVVVGRAKEAKAMEAVMESIVESEPGKPGRESTMAKSTMPKSTMARSTMPKGSAREMAASEAAEVRPATHAAAVHAASSAVATATASTASRERGLRKSNRRTERGRDQATKELLIHLISPWLNCSDGCRRERTSGDRIDPTISTDKGDRF